MKIKVAERQFSGSHSSCGLVAQSSRVYQSILISVYGMHNLKNKVSFSNLSVVVDGALMVVVLNSTKIKQKMKKKKIKHQNRTF